MNNRLRLRARWSARRACSKKLNYTINPPEIGMGTCIAMAIAGGIVIYGDGKHISETGMFVYTVFCTALILIANKVHKDNINKEKAFADYYKFVSEQEKASNQHSLKDSIDLHNKLVSESTKRKNKTKIDTLKPLRDRIDEHNKRVSEAIKRKNKTKIDKLKPLHDRIYEHNKRVNAAISMKKH